MKNRNKVTKWKFLSWHKTERFYTIWLLSLLIRVHTHTSVESSSSDKEKAPPPMLGSNELGEAASNITFTTNEPCPTPPPLSAAAAPLLLTPAASLLLPPATPLAVAAAALAANGLAFLAVWTAPLPAGEEGVALGPCEPRNANKCGVTLSLAMCTAGTYLTKHRAKYQAPPKKRDTR
jgi:hypothetical protein